ncbi:flagellar type III secretion system pore protein FliP [Rickettsia endosymbiont of Cardiosporidium cionae]|uniref:flagellar type III secretion system pore protein FliP n=1 Tax=Rickettsia endosymbiont of Cardiosporidium cionae TaxID=2777155 RepID=UPI001E331F5E|nr:flagellar type III secretion system pore protein FliP [Rickettsia endosymbiont of Cardiosporidium cionae]KAF8818305.1 Flagellar biosynthetic protein FliP [Rickettsia endosymbiont of Cardiosporidium cionae]
MIKTKFNYIIYIIFISYIMLPYQCVADTHNSDVTSLISELSNMLTNGSVSNKIVQILLIITIISIAPSILIMVTSFIRISIVFSILRTALGLQQTPPNQILISLSLFLTFFIMSPTIEESYENGIKPLMAEEISEDKALMLTVQPFKSFMLNNTRTQDIDLFLSIAKKQNREYSKNIEDIELKVLIPSFMISELRRSFEIGFLIFLPFLIIDILVASILMSMGMMMMPPVMIALPFKIIFFVLIDGWYLISGSLMQSFKL